MKKIVYITGCLGFIGSHLTRKCLEMGWYVKGIDKMTYAANKNLLLEFEKYDNFSFEQKDINDLEFLYDCDYVINTAAETHVDNSIVDNDTFLKSNINGVHKLLQLIKNNRNNKKPILLHFSTDEVYGDIEEGSHNEKSLLKPSNPYSATKAAADMMILAWSRTYDIQYVIVRPSNNYGTGQYTEKLIPKVCKCLALGRKIPLHNNGTPVRTWLHADDTADACLKIIDSGVTNEIFNICGTEEKTNLETVSTIVKEYFGKEKDINEFIDVSYTRKGQDVRYSVNDQKLRDLGWTNKRKFDEEIKEIVKYYKDNFIW